MNKNAKLAIVISRNAAQISECEFLLLQISHINKNCTLICEFKVVLW